MYIFLCAKNTGVLLSVVDWRFVMLAVRCDLVVHRKVVFAKIVVCE